MGLPRSGGRVAASLTAWATRQGRRSLVRPDNCAVPPNLGPTFSNKMLETRARSRRPPLPRESRSGGSRQQRGSAGAAAGDAELSPLPARSSPLGPPARSSRRPHPPCDVPTGDCVRCKERGPPGIPCTRTLGSPFGSGPVSCAYLRAGPGNTVRSPGHVWCGVPGVLSVHPPNTKLGAGGREGRMLPPPGTDWRPWKLIRCLRRPYMTSPGGVARDFDPSWSLIPAEFCPGVSISGLCHTQSSQSVVGLTPLFHSLCPDSAPSVWSTCLKRVLTNQSFTLFVRLTVLF